MGKLRVWSSTAHPRPSEFQHYGKDVWTPEAATEKQGVKVLGTPLGHPAFVEALAKQRLEDEERFLAKIEQIPDLQCAWLLLTYCAVPRANHMIRTLTPDAADDYARQHDAALWATFCKLTNAESWQEDRLARQIASIPARCGGLCLRSSYRHRSSLLGSMD